MQSPLQLDAYLIDEVAVSVNVDYEPEGDLVGDVSLQPRHLVNDEHPELHQLVLEVRFGPADSAPGSYPYSGHIVGRGVFHVEQGDSDMDATAKLILVNGTAILLGLLRGHISQITALGLHGPLLLPALNIVQAWEDSRQESSDVAE